MATSPWYTYPMDSPGGTYGKIPDPVCQGSPNCYLKPDVNVCVPSGVPITALASGVVTDVSNPQWGQSVTVQLDNPVNSLATHMAYNYMGSSTVHVGQRVNAGQQVGTARGGSGICTAFALTADSVYGTKTFSQYNGDPRLNPYPLLQALRTGQPLPSGSYTGDTSTSALNSLPLGIGDAITSAITSLQSSFVNFSEEVAVFLIALVLIAMGIMLLMGKEIGGFTKGAVKSGEKAAVMA